MKLHRWLTCLFAAVVWGPTVPAADEARPIPPGQFEQLHKMIRVQSGEQRFWQIPWKLSISEARAQAAKEGKPIFVWAGAGGAPIGVC
jgi:hypothetical protein